MNFLKYILLIFCALVITATVFSQQTEFKINAFVEDFFSVSKSDVLKTSANWGIDSGVIKLNRWRSFDEKENFSVLPAVGNKDVNLKINISDGSLGAVWVSKDSSKVYFSRWNGIIWIKAGGEAGYDILNNGLGSVSSPLLEFDSFGRPNVVWVDSSIGSSGIYFSRWNGSVWSGLADFLKSDNITPSAVRAIYPVLKIDSKGNPNILYQDAGGGGGKLYFTKWNGLKWTKANGETGGYDVIMNDTRWIISSQNLALYKDAPEIAFSRISLENFETKFMKWNGEFWSGSDNQTKGLETVLENTASYDFLIDSIGNPVFCWLNHSDKNIYFKKWESGGWLAANQLSFSGNASSPVIKLAPNGTIGVSWKNETNNDVYFSQLKGGKWAMANSVAGAERVTKIGVSGFKYLFDKNSNPVFAFTKYFGLGDSAYILFFTKWNGEKWTGADSNFLGADRVGLCLSSAFDLLYNFSNNNIFSFCSNNDTERAYKYSAFFPVSQEAVSSRIFTASSGFGIYNAKLIAKDEVPGKTSISYFVSASDGADWFLVEKDKVFNFTEPGIDLKWKALLNTSDHSKTPLIYEVKIEYTVSTGALIQTEEIKPEKEVEAEIRPEGELQQEPIIEAEKEITIEIKEPLKEPAIITTQKAVSNIASKIIPKVNIETEKQTPIERVIDVSSGVVTATSVTTAVAVSTGVTAIGTARAAVSLFDLPLFFARFVSGFFTFFSLRRKSKKPWGVVYDSQTKQPLDPVQVTLFNENGGEITTAITDLEGRFGFFPEPGRYKLKANKTNYQFPSRKLFGKIKDEIYDNLYFGEVVDVLEKGVAVNINIPMDSEKFDWNEFAKKELGYIKINPKKEKLKTIFSKTIFFSGLFSAPVFYLFNPNITNLLFIGFYLIIIATRLFGRKRRSFGLVYDSTTNTPLSFAVVKVYYANLDYMIKSTICDKFGRYNLIIPKGKYYLKIERKEADGSYKLVSKTNNFTVKKGYINLKLKI